MTANPFQPAIRSAARARVAIDGPSGSGKTYTGLIFAEVLAAAGDGPLAVIDTERNSASLYADEFTFETVDFAPPYSPERYIEYIRQAAEHGYGAVLIDSLSHGWNAPGGVLEMVDTAGARMGGNRFAGWSVGTPAQNALVQAIISAPIHIVATMRTKQEWIIEEDDRGNKKPRRVGMQPQQRDGIEYEFTIVADMDLDHKLIVSKSRAKPMSDQVVVKPGRTFAQMLVDWLNTGTALASQGQIAELKALLKQSVALGKATPGADQPVRDWYATHVENRANGFSALSEIEAGDGIELIRTILPDDIAAAADAEGDAEAAALSAQAAQTAATERAEEPPGAHEPDESTAPDTQPPGETPPVAADDPDGAPFTEPPAANGDGASTEGTAADGPQPTLDIPAGAGTTKKAAKRGGARR